MTPNHLDIGSSSTSCLTPAPCLGPTSCQTTPTRASSPPSDPSEGSNDDQDWDDWEEDAAIETCSVVYPSVVLPSIEAAIEHDLRTHQFCLKSLIKRLNLDTLRRIKLINWIRAGPENSRPKQELLNLSGNEDWLVGQSDHWLKPQLPKDGLLQLDFDDDFEAEEPFKVLPNISSQATEPSDKPNDVNHQLTMARQKLQSLQCLLERMVLTNHDSLSSSNHNSSPPRDDDTHYFSSYAHDLIHSSMIQDHVRTSAYHDFISMNPEIFKGKRIMDIGCGTGILSFFAAQAGAKRVYAIDASEIAINAAEHIKHNGVSEVVRVINKKVEDIDLHADLDGERVDVIISEWMGYACVYEVFLPSVLFARDQFLKPREEGGVMAPSQCSILMAGWGDEAWWNDRVAWWDENQYGFKMGSTMTKRLFQEGLVENLSDKGVLTSTFILRDIHTSTMPPKPSECVEFTTEFSLACADGFEGGRKFCGFAVWFDTFFTTDGRLVTSLALENDVNWKTSPGDVGFSTSPRATDTHWHQTLLAVKEPFTVTKGTVISGTFSCSVNPENSRELIISIIWQVQKEGYQSSHQAQVWNI